MTPAIMLCCAVGLFAIGDNMFGVVTLARSGVNTMDPHIAAPVQATTG